MAKEIVEIEDRRLDLVEAEFMTIRQSSIRSVEGGHIELQQVGALSIDGEKVEVTQGACALMKGENISLNQSAAFFAAGNTTNLNYSFSPVSVSMHETTANRSAVGVMAAREINSQNSASILMIGKDIHGTVTTLLDWKSALALGAVTGGVLGLFSLLRKR
ncbi:MAG: hypothetical protein HGA78_03185 [Nitrospirales bacterium]|nr:hypothetical protein [Nitrospirales bacterium]